MQPNDCTKMRWKRWLIGWSMRLAPSTYDLLSPRQRRSWTINCRGLSLSAISWCIDGLTE